MTDCGTLHYIVATRLMLLCEADPTHYSALSTWSLEPRSHRRFRERFFEFVSHRIHTRTHGAHSRFVSPPPSHLNIITPRFFFFEEVHSTVLRDLSLPSALYLVVADEPQEEPISKAIGVRFRLHCVSFLSFLPTAKLNGNTLGQVSLPHGHLFIGALVCVEGKHTHTHTR